MRIEVPGKIVLIGEYAVLDGAPAIVAAIDRGVACDIEPCPTFSIETPGDDRFARAGLRAAHAPPARYVFSDWRPGPTAAKMGIGGSAAATVAAVRAAHACRRENAAPADIFCLARQIHHEVQGSGSGLDVAASSYGGVIRFQTDGRIECAAAPPFCVVHTGVAAATAPRVERYLAHASRQSFVQRSAQAVERFVRDPIGAVHAVTSLLRSTADAAGFSYWSAAIEHLVTLAAQHGGAAKPSGAGGGDIVVAFFADPQAQRSFEAEASRAGFVVVDVDVASPTGTRPQERPATRA